MRHGMIAGPLLAAALVTGPVLGAEISGEARVSDGDTLVIDSLHIRLYGVDAPETGQSCQTAQGADWDCGAAAKARMEALTAGQTVRCQPADQDRYGRTVARCAAGDVDLGGTLVAEGLAWAYVKYSPLYASAEAEAHKRALGIWQGRAQVAWDYRAGRFVEASGGPPDAACAIKGNINSKGVKIYHMPGTRWYEGVHVNESAGERWFCDPAEAEAAGWRPVGGK